MSRSKIVVGLACIAILTPATAISSGRSTRSSERLTSCEALTPYHGRALPPVEEQVSKVRESHAMLREMSHAAFPSSKTTILIMLSSGHHDFTTLSYVATRDKRRQWTVDKVGRTTSELPEVPARLHTVIQRVLPADQGKLLDVLLNDRCLYAQPYLATISAYPPGLGGWETSIAVVSPKGKYVGRSSGPMPSVAGKIVSAVTGW
jgi:hypothetical protein